MRFPIQPPAKKARIEIIPLIDVIFFLLATFVLVSLSMTRLQGIELQMPQASSAPATDQPEVVIVSVMADGGYVWNHRRMTRDQVLSRMAQYRRESPDPRILVNGEENADFGNAIEILDTARKLGISKVSIKTKPQPVTVE